MAERYRDLQEIFSLKRLPTEDIERLIWWGKGIRVGYKGMAFESLPEDCLDEFIDGGNFGNQLYITGCKLV